MLAVVSRVRHPAMSSRVRHSDRVKSQPMNEAQCVGACRLSSNKARLPERKGEGCLWCMR